MDLMMNFVTGATGFIGRHLVRRLLESGEGVYALSRRQNRPVPSDPRNALWIQGDITKKVSLPDDVTTVYHCAGCISDEKQMEAVNVLGTRKIIEAAAKKDCRLIHLSSAGVVGRTGQEEITEEISCNPQNRYEKTKYEAEKLVLNAACGGLQVQVLRPTIVFGMGRNPMQDSMLHLICAIKNNRYKDISDGKGIFNIIHVDEVVRAMRALDDERIPNGGHYFIDGSITFGEFARIVKNELTPGDETVFSLPYLTALSVAAAFSGIAAITGKRMPLSLSRLRALTNRKIFFQKRLLKMTSYRPLLPTESYVRRICREYSERGMLD